MTDQNDAVFAALKMAEDLKEATNSLRQAAAAELQATAEMRRSVLGVISSLPDEVARSAKGLHSIWFPQAVKELDGIRTSLRTMLEDMKKAGVQVQGARQKATATMYVAVLAIGAGLATAVDNWRHHDADSALLDRLDATQQRMHSVEVLLRDLLEKQRLIERSGRKAKARENPQQ